MLFLSAVTQAWGWGQDAHSVIAEIAQRRLTPEASAMVARLLGSAHSLASIASWADDIRDERPETYNWHFVDIPLAKNNYVPSRDCRPSAQGDCIVAELERLRSELRCAPSEGQKRDALRYAVHLVADIHQPLHTVGDYRGGNDIQVEVQWTELKCRRNCRPREFRRNFHALWDETLIASTAWSWGAYVDRLENGWLGTLQARGHASAGSPVDWALETHKAAQVAWNLLPADGVVDDAYYRRALPIVDRQLGLAGLRLARFLNEAYASPRCPVSAGAR